MHIVTAEEMRALDRETIDRIGIPALVLMENAGRETAREIETFFSESKGPWLVLVGKGNNGGDGVVIARHLREAGYEAHLLYAETPDKLTGEAAVQRDIAERLGLTAAVYQPGEVAWTRYVGIVDALLGTGTKGAPREPYASLIREANRSGLPVVAVDIPSGLDADTGAVHDPCIRAVRTVALAFLKSGLVQHPGAEFAGEVTVAPIGIPTELADRRGVHTFWLHPRFLREELGLAGRQRQANAHKGTYGHLLVVAGTRRMSGAGMLCTRAALQAGAGLVTWAVPDRLLDALVGQVPEAMLAGIADGGRGDWSAASADDVLALAEERSVIAVGPGLDRFDGGEQFVRVLWEGVSKPLVVDADALNLMAPTFAEWPRREAPTVLTPHPGEMARLCGLTTREVQSDRIRIAREFAERHGMTLILKGARTVIATPDGAAYVNPTGNPGMASGGTGDVLTGIVAALLAQGLSTTQAACLGAYLHGLAGDLAAKKRGMNALVAGDLIEEIGAAAQTLGVL